MRVKLLTLMAGPDGVVQPGAIVDLPDDRAGALVAGGYAEATDDEPTKPPPAATTAPRVQKIEAATLLSPPETTTARQGRPSGREPRR